MHQSLKNYFHISRQEAIGALVLAAIIIPFALLPFFNNEKDNEAKSGDQNWASVSQVLDEKAPTNNNDGGYTSKSRYQTRYASGKSSTITNVRLFNFDPNSVSPDELKQLGLRDKTVQIIGNYRSKGGKFRKPDDLQKIYGLRPEEFERLKPFIVIAAANDQNRFNTKHENNPYVTVTNKDYKRKVVAIDINMADTTAFQSLYGIGSKLAARIVNFRNKLGGFYSIEQVGETYGVPDSTFQKIKPYLKLNGAEIHKMNINTATYEELNAHPYISSKLAFQIMKYRKDNDNFTNLERLRDIIAQTSDSFEKVVNYLAL